MQPAGGAPPILFAHRGGRAHARGNTMPAFREALRRGAPGIESDVRISLDGKPVLVHDAAAGVLRRPVAQTLAARLPRSVTPLRDFYAELGVSFALSLDVKAVAAFAPSVEVAAECGALGALWLCGGLDDVLRWRAQDVRPHLVHSTRLRQIRRDLASIAARLHDGGIDAINLPARDWNQQRVDIVHAAGLLAFGWDAHRLGAVVRLVRLGCDAVYGDDVDVLLAGAAHARELGGV